MTTRRPESEMDITREQEVGRREDLEGHYTGVHFLEDMGAAVYGKVDGKNLVLIALAYRVGGSWWGTTDTIINNSTFHVAPYEQTELEDNDFISHRIDPFSRNDDFTIVDDGEMVTWKVGDRRYTARPPLWDIKGEHLGIDCNVTMERFSSPDWHVGTWDEMAQNGRGGRDFWGKATGTINARGEIYELGDKSIALHEHLVVGEHWVSKAGGSVQYFYHIYKSEDFQILIYSRPDFDVTYARIEFNDGRELFFEGLGQQVTIKPVEHWLDPQSFMRPPVAFEIRLHSPEATVEFSLKAYSRAIYSYSMAESTRTHYSLLVHSSGTFAGADGKRFAIKDAYEDVCYAEWGCTNTMGHGGPLEIIS